MTFKGLAVASVLIISLILAGCGSESGESNEADSEFHAPTTGVWYQCPTDDDPSNATIVTAFDQVDQYFAGGTDNQRKVEADVDFPTSGNWKEIGMRLNLECPESGLCDHWDRLASISLIQNPDDEDNREEVELLRYITPYRLEMCNYVDVMAFASLLTGKQRLESYIDTWVKAGHDNGEGWRVSIEFIFVPGDPEVNEEVINLWGRTKITVGSEAEGETIADQIEPISVDIPADAQKVQARLVATGHSFGLENTDNCAEFCVLDHHITVNSSLHIVRIWRDDCALNPVSNQYGTWEFPRQGWCPGAVAYGEFFDITDDLDPGETNTINFDIRKPDGTPYIDQNPAGTPPHEFVALQLIVQK